MSPSAEPVPPGHRTFVGHLLELRARLIVCVAAVTCCTLLAWVFHSPILDGIERPFQNARAQCAFRDDVMLITADPMTPVTVIFRLGIVAGLLLALPIFIQQTWSFVRPALRRDERRAVLPILYFGLAMFLAGAALCYLVVTPFALRFLLEFSHGRGWAPIWDFSAYFSLMLGLHLGFGAVFEVPLVVFFLIRANLVSHRAFAGRRKYVLLGAVVLGAVLTPTGDPFTQLVMAGTVYALYEAGLLLARLMPGPGRRREEA